MDFDYDLNKREVTFRIKDLPKDIQDVLISTLDVNGFLQDEKNFRNLVANNIHRLPGVSPKNAKRLALIIRGGDLLVLERDAEKNQFGLDFSLNKYKFSLSTVPGKPDLPPLKHFLAREMLYAALEFKPSEPRRCTKFWISPDGKFYDIAPYKEHCTWAAHFVKSTDSCEKLLNEGWVRGGYEQGAWGGKGILMCFLHTLRKESLNSEAVAIAVNIAEGVDIDIRGDYTHFLIKDWKDSGHSLGDYAGKQLLFRFKKTAAYHWSDSPTRYKDRFEIGNRVRVAREFQNEGEWECMCGNYTGYGTYNFDEILGHIGTVVKIYPSNHAKSGFSFDDYDVLLDDDSTPEGLEGTTIHLNFLSLEDIESPFSVKVKEPSKEKLDLLKKQIADLEKTDPGRAKQLYHQYESLTKEAKMPSLKEIQQIVKDESWQKLREDLSWTKDNINSSIRRLHKYLGPNPSRFKKVRVLNLLNGVARGGIMTPAIERFQKRLRKQLGVGGKQSALSLLDSILKKVANVAHEGKRPIVAFDIDDTLLATFGGKVIPGALDFIHSVIAYKGTVVYITSRPEAMRDDTVAKLAENKFPVDGNAILLMYPEGNKKDTYSTPQFKYDSLRRANEDIGLLVGWFDNESSNANVGKKLADELGQDITIVKLNTREHNPEKLLPGVETIKDFKKEAGEGYNNPDYKYNAEAHKASVALRLNPEKATPELLALVAKDAYAAESLLLVQPQLWTPAMCKAAAEEPDAYYGLAKGLSRYYDDPEKKPIAVAILKEMQSPHAAWAKMQAEKRKKEDEEHDKELDAKREEEEERRKQRIIEQEEDKPRCDTCGRLFGSDMPGCPRCALKKEAHCGACTPLKMEAIRMLSDMHFELENFDKKYLGQLAALSEAADAQPFVDVLNNVVDSIKESKELEEKLRKLRQIAVTLQDVQYRLTDGEFKKEASLEEQFKQLCLEEEIFEKTSGFMPSLPRQPFWDQRPDGGGAGDYKYPLEQLVPARTQIPEGSEQEVLPEYDAADQAFSKIPQKRYPAMLLKLLRMFKPIGDEETKELKKLAAEGGIVFNVDPDIKYLPSSIVIEIKDPEIGGKYTATLVEATPKKYSPPSKEEPAEEKSPLHWMPIRPETPYRPGLRAIELEKASYEVIFDKDNKGKAKLTPGLVIGKFDVSDNLKYLRKSKEGEGIRKWLKNKLIESKEYITKLDELRQNPKSTEWETKMYRKVVEGDWEEALKIARGAGVLTPETEDYVISSLLVSLLKNQDFERALIVIDVNKMAKKGSPLYKSTVADRLEDIKVLAGKSNLAAEGTNDYHRQVNLILDGEKDFFPNISVEGSSEIKRDVIANLPHGRLEKFIKSEDFSKQPYPVIAEAVRRLSSLGREGEKGLHDVWENTELPASIRRSVLDELTRKYGASSEEYSEEKTQNLRKDLLEKGLSEEDPTVRTKALSLIVSPKVGFLPWATDENKNVILLYNKELAKKYSRWSKISPDFFGFIEDMPSVARRYAFDLIKYLPPDLIEEVRTPKFASDRQTLKEEGLYVFKEDVYSWVKYLVKGALQDADTGIRKKTREYFGLDEETIPKEKEEIKVIMPAKPTEPEVKKEPDLSTEINSLSKQIDDKYNAWVRETKFVKDFSEWTAQHMYNKGFDKLTIEQQVDLLKAMLSNDILFDRWIEQKEPVLAEKYRKFKGKKPPTLAPEEKKPEEGEEPTITDDMFKEGAPLSKLEIESRQPPTTWPLSNPQVGYGAAVPLAPRDEGLLLQPTQQFFGRPKGKFQSYVKELWDALFGDNDDEKEEESQEEQSPKEPSIKKVAADLPKNKEEADKLLGGDNNQIKLAVDYYISTQDKKGLLEAIKASPDKETLKKILEVAVELKAPELVEEIFSLPSPTGFGVDEVALPSGTNPPFPGGKRYKQVPSFKGFQEGDIHESALEAYYKMGDVNAIEKALYSKEWYPLAIKYLLALGKEDRIVELYDETKDIEKLRVIVSYLGEKNIDFLEKALKSPHAEVRTQAISWLAYHRKFDVLKEHLTKEKNSKAQIAIKKILADYASGPVSDIMKHYKPEERKEKINSLVKIARDAFTLWDRYPDIREEVMKAKAIRVETRGEWEANQERIDRHITEAMRSQPTLAQGKEALEDLKKIAEGLPSLDERRKWLSSWIAEMKKRVEESSERPEGISDEAWDELQKEVKVAQDAINQKEFELAEMSGPQEDLLFIIKQLEQLQSEATLKDELMWRVKSLPTFKDKFGGGKGGPGGPNDPTFVDYEAYKAISSLSEEDAFKLGGKFAEDSKLIQSSKKKREDAAWERTDLMRSRLEEIQEEVAKLNKKLKPYFERARAPSRAGGEVLENEIKFHFDKNDNVISPEEVAIQKKIAEVEDQIEEQLRRAGKVEPHVLIDNDFYHIAPERWVNPGEYGDVPLFIPGTRVVRMPSIWEPKLKELRRQRKEIHRAFEKKKMEVLPLEARKVAKENKEMLAEAEKIRQKMASLGVVTYRGEYLSPEEIRKKEEKRKNEYDKRRKDLAEQLQGAKKLQAENPEGYIKFRRELAKFIEDYKVRPLPDTPDYTYRLQWHRDRWRSPGYLTHLTDLPVVAPKRIK